MVFVVKLGMENDPSFFRIEVEFSSRTFSLIIINDKSAFKGQVTPDYITDQSKALNLSEDDYILELNKALKILPDSNLFTFNISDDTFHIKKKIETSPRSAIKVKFCSIQLTKLDFTKSLVDMLDSTLAENQKCLDRITALQSNNEMLIKGNELLHQQLEQFQEAKNGMENILYRQFLNLINSKKRKIRQLEQRLGIEIEDDDVVFEKEEIMETEQTDLYEVETDIDEENELERAERITTKTKKSEEADEVQKSEEVSPKSEECNDIKKPWNIKEFINSNDSDKESGGSNVQRILNAMSFLDPSVPFVA